MNSKLCKTLRRRAQSQTVGQPNVAYKAIHRNKPNPLFNPFDPMSFDPMYLEPAVIDKIQLILDPRCTRAVYQKAKAAA